MIKKEGQCYMTRIDDDFLLLICMLSEKKTARGIYPYKKTIVNIFKGNDRSGNASTFKESRFYGKYPYFNTTIFDSLLSKYSSEYLRRYDKNGKYRFYANKKLKDYVKDFSINMDYDGIMDDKEDNTKIFEILNKYFD